VIFHTQTHPERQRWSSGYAPKSFLLAAPLSPRAGVFISTVCVA